MGSAALRGWQAGDKHYGERYERYGEHYKHYGKHYEHYGERYEHYDGHKRELNLYGMV